MDRNSGCHLRNSEDQGKRQSRGKRVAHGDTEQALIDEGIRGYPMRPISLYSNDCGISG